MKATMNSVTLLVISGVCLILGSYTVNGMTLRNGYYPFNGRDLIASPSMGHPRPRKVMSKTFQRIINNDLNMGNRQNMMDIKSTNPILPNTVTPNPFSVRQSGHSFNMGNNFLRNRQLPLTNHVTALNVNNNVPKLNGPLKSDQEIRRQLINIINNMSPQQLSKNAQGLLDSAQQLNNIIGQKTEQTVNVKVTRKKSFQVPFPSLINKNVNGLPSRTPVVRKTPIITMVPKSNQPTKIQKPLMERKKLTMIEKMSAMKAGAETTVQNAMSNFQKGSIATIDSNKKIQVFKNENNTAEVKIINQGTGATGKNDPNFIVLKDITIKNNTDGTNGTKMFVTLMSQATGGRPIVIEANSNIVLSQEKMANGTVQFVVKTDTNSTALETTTPISTSLPTEEQEIEAEETTTVAALTTTGEV